MMAYKRLFSKNWHCGTT